jgi:hypothetical protein
MLKFINWNETELQEGIEEITDYFTFILEIFYKIEINQIKFNSNYLKLKTNLEQFVVIGLINLMFAAKRNSNTKI